MSPWGSVSIGFEYFRPGVLSVWWLVLTSSQGIRKRLVPYWDCNQKLHVLVWKPAQGQPFRLTLESWWWKYHCTMVGAESKLRVIEEFGGLSTVYTSTLKVKDFSRFKFWLLLELAWPLQRKNTWCGDTLWEGVVCLCLSEYLGSIPKPASHVDIQSKHSSFMLSSPNCSWTHQRFR